MATQRNVITSATKQRISCPAPERILNMSDFEDFGGSPDPSNASLAGVPLQDFHTPTQDLEGTLDPELVDGADVLAELDALREQVLAQAQQEAAELTEQARQRAISMLEQTKQEADQVREQAYQEAYAKGLEQGQIAGADEVRTEVEHTQRLFKQWQQQMEQAQQEMMSTMEHHALTLSLALARKVVHDEVHARSDAIAPLLRKGIAMLSEQQEVVLWVSHDDAVFAHQYRDELLKSFTRVGILHVQVKDELAHGECLIETNQEMVDLSFDERFRLAAQFLEQIEASQPSTDTGNADGR